MEIGTVSTLALAGMLFTAILCVLLPVALCCYLVIVRKARFTTFLLGCVTFVFSALVLEPILHNVIFGLTGSLLTDNLLLYAVYGGLAAALFEETGRYIAMKSLLKAPKTLDSIMYGVGHGGIEALLVGALSAVSNLSASLMINNGAVEETLVGVDAASREAALENLSQLWTLPGGVFFLSGIERVIAFALQVALSVLVYRGIRAKSKKHIFSAYLLHFGVDAGAVLATQIIPSALVEVLLLIAVAAIWWFLAMPAYRQCEKEKL